tara:strand:+ start:332 stop:1741 length:1410 start_codon:yes stop_codon:yes gene_type:complete
MAGFVPSTIIQTPDFLGMAQQRQGQMNKQKAATSNYIDDYKQTGENYLEGFIPAVQQEWNGVEQAMNNVAANDNVGTRRDLDNAYSQYSRLAGQAKFLTEGFHKNTSEYRSDPSAFGVNYDEYIRYSDSFRYTPQTSNSLLAMDEYVVPKSMEFQITAPNEMAKTILGQLEDRIESDFYNDQTGEYDYNAIMEVGRSNLIKTVGYGTDNMEMATVYGGLRSMGKNSITNSQQYNFIMSQADEDKLGYQNDYIDNTMSLFSDGLKRRGDKNKGVADADKYLKTFTAENLDIYDDNGSMVIVPRAEGITLSRPVNTTYGYATPMQTTDQISERMYGEEYDELNNKEKAIVEKEHSSQNKKGVVGREIKVKEKIIKFYKSGGNYFVETESAIDDDLSKKIMALKATVGGAIMIQEDGKVMTTTRRAQDSEVSQILSNKGIQNAFSGDSKNVNDPQGIFGESVTSEADPINIL